MSNHDWSVANPDVAVAPVAGIAVFVNQKGEVTILQEDLDQEQLISIPLSHLPSLIAALQRVVQEGQCRTA